MVFGGHSLDHSGYLVGRRYKVTHRCGVVCHVGKVHAEDTDLLPGGDRNEIHMQLDAVLFRVFRLLGLDHQ